LARRSKSSSRQRGVGAKIKIQERDGEQPDNPPAGEKIFFMKSF
jgi:hypothetical protein